MPEYSYKCEACNEAWSVFCKISSYKEKRSCPSCKKVKPVNRDYGEDDVYGAYAYSLSETKTIGHYADKQTKKYGTNKTEDMIQSQKTKKTQGGGELPAGMSRINSSEDRTQWTKKETSKKRRHIKRRKK